MRLYHVQLETRDKIYSYEVYSDDFDAVGRARTHLATLVGASEAALAHNGGYSQIGKDPDVTEPRVHLREVYP